MAGGRTCAVGLPQPNGPVQRDEQDEQSARKEAPVPVKGAQPAAPAQETGCFRYPFFQDPLDLDVMEDPVGDDRIEAIALDGSRSAEATTYRRRGLFSRAAKAISRTKSTAMTALPSSINREANSPTPAPRSRTWRWDSPSP